MEMKRVRTGILLMVFLWIAAVVSAPAADSGFYIGITGGKSSFGLTQRELDLNLRKALELDNGFALPFVDPRLDSLIDTHSSAFTGLVGYRINRGVAVEAAYVDLGKTTYRASGVGTRFVEGRLTPVEFNANLKTEVSGAALSLVADLFPPKRWELFLRGGVFFADTKRSSRVVAGSFVTDLGVGSETSTDFLVGIGTTRHFTNRWSARLEYERFLNVGGSDLTENDITLVSLGLLMHF